MCARALLSASTLAFLAQPASAQPVGDPLARLAGCWQAEGSVTQGMTGDTGAFHTEQAR